MGYWLEEKYFYTRGELEYIARNYTEYLGARVGGQCFDKTRRFAHFDISQSKDALRLDMLSSKTDFDRALNALGKGYWSGTHFGNDYRDIEFKMYKPFGRKQQIVIADILGIEDWDLERMGFYDIEKLRKPAYYSMVKFLNGFGAV